MKGGGFDSDDKDVCMNRQTQFKSEVLGFFKHFGYLNQIFIPKYVY